MLNRPIVRVTGAGTALGAALLAAVGSAHPDLSRAAAAMVPAGEPFDPVDSEVSRLDESYRQFRAELSARGWIGADP